MHGDIPPLPQYAFMAWDSVGCYFKSIVYIVSESRYVVKEAAMTYPNIFVGLRKTSKDSDYPVSLSRLESRT
jgi:hypothetical protein